MQLKLFKTPTCANCEPQRDILERIAGERDDVELEVIDATQNVDEANRYNARSFPATVVVGDDGTPRAQFIGLTPTEKIEAEL